LDAYSIYEPGDAGRFATIAVYENNVVHVAFFQTNDLVLSAGQAQGSILYGNNQGSEWRFQEVGTVDKQILGIGARAADRGLVGRRPGALCSIQRHGEAAVGASIGHRGPANYGG